MVRLEVRVEKILKIRKPVLGSHLKKRLAVGMIPVKVRRDIVSRDRKGKNAAFRVPFHHDFNVGFVDHRHFFLKIAVDKVHFLAADHGVFFAEILGADPVKSHIRKRSLSSPARGNIQVVDELLDALLDLFIGKLVDADERGKIGIKGRERLGTCPFILKRAEKIDHPTAEVKCLGGPDSTLSGTPLKPSRIKVFSDQPAQ